MLHARAIRTQATNGLRTFTILTTKPNELVAPIHDRMPVILAPADYERWLGDEPDPADLVRPYSTDQMVSWPGKHAG